MQALAQGDSRGGNTACADAEDVAHGFTVNRKVKQAGIRLVFTALLVEGPAPGQDRLDAVVAFRYIAELSKSISTGGHGRHSFFIFREQADDHIGDPLFGFVRYAVAVRIGISIDTDDGISGSQHLPFRFRSRSDRGQIVRRHCRCGHSTVVDRCGFRIEILFVVRFIVIIFRLFRIIVVLIFRKRNDVCIRFCRGCSLWSRCGAVLQLLHDHRHGVG